MAAAENSIMKFILIILALLYTICPYDLLPDFFIGWGWIDDLVILWFTWRYLFSSKPKAFRQSPENGYYEETCKNSYAQNQYEDNHFDEPQQKEDPYMVLGIKKNATSAEIRKAYRELANKYHPDKVSHLGEEFKKLADIRFKEIQNAYQKLQSKS